MYRRYNCNCFGKFLRLLNEIQKYLNIGPENGMEITI